MGMTFLPVVGRELRVASRRPWNYWARTVSAGIALGLCAWILLVDLSSSPSDVGKSLFAATSFVAFAYALLAGVVFSADSLSSESREGTLGLLFLTDLRGHDVLLGKLASSSLGCVFHLGAALPVLAMSMLLGGVTFAEFLRMVAVLLTTLFLSLAAGMAASTLSTDGKRAAALALGLMVAACGAVPGLGGLGVWAAQKAGGNLDTASAVWTETCSWTSPVPLYFWAFDARAGAGARFFGRAMGFSWGLALAFLAWGSVRLPRMWQTRDARPGRKGVVARIEAWRWPTPAAQAAFRTRLLEMGPLVWLAGRRWMGCWGVWGFLAAVGVAFVAVGIEVGKDWFEAPTYLTVSILVHLVLKLWIASEAPRQFLDDRRSGAMELLLSTSLGVDDIVHGRLRALRRQFGVPVLVVLVADLLFMLGAMPSDANEWVSLWLARMGLLVVDGYALAWSGMWQGLSARGSRTTLPVLFRVIILPWLVTLGLATLGALGGGFGAVGFAVLVWMWCLLCVVVDWVWIGLARMHLLSEFREFGRTRPGEKKSGAAA